MRTRTSFQTKIWIHTWLETKLLRRSQLSFRAFCVGYKKHNYSLRIVQRHVTSPNLQERNDASIFTNQKQVCSSWMRVDVAVIIGLLPDLNSESTKSLSAWPSIHAKLTSDLVTALFCIKEDKKWLLKWEREQMCKD